MYRISRFYTFFYIINFYIISFYDKVTIFSSENICETFGFHRWLATIIIPLRDLENNIDFSNRKPPRIALVLELLGMLCKSMK